MDQEKLMRRHLELVLKANQITNLTRIDTIEEGLILHIEDSLAGLKEVEEAPVGLYGDMGTGGGYPGMPLAVATGRETLLIDSVRKKTDILQEIIAELGLQQQVSTYHGRLEDLAKEKKGSFSVLTARALSRFSSLLELASPLLKINGRLVCYKAHVSVDEIESLAALESKLGMKFVSSREFVLSDGVTSRCIVVFEKYKKPEMKLPRKAGDAQKKPLC